MTAPDTVITNTLEQILSSDLNRIGGFAAKGVQDALRYLESGPFDTGPRSVVRTGLGATAGAGLSVDLTAGELLSFDASGQTIDTSGYELGRLDSDTNVSGFTPDPANPRVAVIGVEPAQLNAELQTRNILTLPSRVVTPTAVYKRSSPDLTVTVTLGAAAANPVLPSPPAGATAIWYVYIPAAATSLLDADLADARIRQSAWPNSRRHERVGGLIGHPSLDSDTTSVTLRSGTAFVNGAYAEHLQDQYELDRQEIGTGGPPIVYLNGAEYQLYLVAAGSGDPVGKSVTDGIIPVLTTNNPPNSDGRPSVALTYRPWVNTAGGGRDNVTTSTTDALFVGTLVTDSAANWCQAGSGWPVNKDGTFSIRALAAIDGLSGAIPTKGNAWMGRPKLTYVAADQVRVERCNPVLQGIPHVFTGLAATMAGNLHSGEAEQPFTWYYVYLRNQVSMAGFPRGVPRQLVPVISSAPPDQNFLNRITTPEAGFTAADYIYVGSFFNNVAGDILAFEQEGDHYFFTAPGGAPRNVAPPGGGQQLTLTPFAITQAPGALAMGSFCPKTSRIVMVTFRHVSAVAAVNALLFHRTGNTIAAGNEHYAMDPQATETMMLNLRMIVDDNEQWEAARSTANLCANTYLQQGYIENIEHLSVRS
jgi:hypothetical protein